MTFLVASLWFQTVSMAAGPPRRPLPESVLQQLDTLEGRFEQALSLDCDETRCFSTGCVYVDHHVADRPKGGSLPGLGDPVGPGAVDGQPWLTKAECGFAHEPAVEADDVRVLVRRLQSRVSTGWLSVSISSRAMDPLPAYFRTEAEVEEEAVEALPPPPPPPDPTPSEQLWEALLPHTFWMVGLGLFTLTALVLIWAARRVGKASIEEEMLLAELARAGSASGEGDDAGDAAAARSAAYVAEQQADWNRRLVAFDAADPDPALHALVRDRLLAGDIPFLAKAALRFPDHFPAIFPEGGDVAAAKLGLADYLRTADLSQLPDDQAFFQALAQHAAAGRVVAQSDADMMRRLRDDYGATGLALTIQGLSPRLGGLLFSRIPPDRQQEVVRLLSPRQVAAMADQLLASNRIDPKETEQLFAVVRGEDPSETGLVTDLGAELDVAGALSLLLSHLAPDSRSILLSDALRRFHGHVPGWYGEIFVADMLETLPAESRADLLLAVDAEQLGAWLADQDSTAVDRLRAVMPESLRSTLASLVTPADEALRARSARAGHGALARAFQVQIARHGVSFEAVLTGRVGDTA